MLSFLLTARSCVKTYLLCCESDSSGGWRKATFRTQPNHDGDYLLVSQPLFVMQIIVGTDCLYFLQAMNKINLAQMHAITIIAQLNLNNTFNLNSINTKVSNGFSDKNLKRFLLLCIKSYFAPIVLITTGINSLQLARGIFYCLIILLLIYYYFT